MWDPKLYEAVLFLREEQFSKCHCTSTHAHLGGEHTESDQEMR